jgi:hypothetical protein
MFGVQELIDALVEHTVHSKAEVFCYQLTRIKFVEMIIFRVVFFESFLLHSVVELVIHKEVSLGL